MDIGGLAFLILFYTSITILGFWTGYIKDTSSTVTHLFLAQKNLGFKIGVLALLATQAGGLFILGTASEVYSKGIIWCALPFAYSLGLIINGSLLLPEMRSRDYITVADALQGSYGQIVGTLIFIPEFLRQIIWSAALLASLGSTVNILLDFNLIAMICVSAGVAVFYVIWGGMFSVAYTNVLHLFFSFLGLWIAVVFLLISDSVQLSSLTIQDWTGEISKTNVILLIDSFLVTMCGIIPWQEYYQIALSLPHTPQAQKMSYVSAIIAIFFAIPSILIGGAAKSSDHIKSLTKQDFIFGVLPRTVKELNIKMVNYFTLGLLCASSMSSMDSCLLAGASFLSHNMFKGLFRARTSKVILTFRFSALLIGILSAMIATFPICIYDLWFLALDLNYIIVFPQFVSSILIPLHVNWFGSITSGICGLLLRILLGEKCFELPSMIPYWTFEGTNDLVLPIKSILMLSSTMTLILCSRLYDWFHGRNRIPSNDLALF